MFAVLLPADCFGGRRSGPETSAIGRHRCRKYLEEHKTYQQTHQMRSWWRPVRHGRQKLENYDPACPQWKLRWLLRWTSQKLQQNHRLDQREPTQWLGVHRKKIQNLNLYFHLRRLTNYVIVYRGTILPSRICFLIIKFPLANQKKKKIEFLNQKLGGSAL